MFAHNQFRTVYRTFRTWVFLGFAIEFPRLEQSTLLVFRRIITFQCVLNLEQIRLHVVITYLRERIHGLQSITRLIVIERTALHVEQPVTVAVGKCESCSISRTLNQKQCPVCTLYDYAILALQIISTLTVRYSNRNKSQRNSTFVSP